MTALRPASLTRSATRSTTSATRSTLARVAGTLDRMERREVDRLEARRRRSLELAQAAGLGPFSVVFRSLEVGIDGQPTRVDVDAPSGSVLFLAHHVVVDLRAASPSCDCIAGGFGKPCRHAGAALLYGECVVRAYAEAEAEYFAAVRADERARALRPSL